MIIQCEQCQTKFRLDDSRIKDTGVKVRCAKCRHVFTVRKEQPQAAQPVDFGALLDQTPSYADQPPPSEPLAQNQEFSLPDTAAEQQDETLIAPPSVQSVSVSDLDFSAFESRAEEPFAPEPPKAEFTFEAQEPPADMTLVSTEPNPFTSQDIDFGTVDFGAAPPPTDTDSPPPLPAEQVAFAAPAGDTDQPADSHEFTFGEPETPPPAEPEPAIAEPAPQPAPQPPPVEPPPVIPVSVSQPEIQPSPVPPQPAKPAVEQIPPAPAEDELPPLSIPSRRKDSSLLKVLMVLLLVAILGALGYYGKDYYQKLMPKPAEETGKIILRSVNSSYVKNTVTGSELLVISGEAVNGFTAPRAALQVKGMIYGDKDQILVSKNAYCGNPLSAEQLAGMPLDAIEAAMANQLGSGLTNLEVAPGKAIPFTVVITTLPAGAKDFGVEPAGSQAISDKSK